MEWDEAYIDMGQKNAIEKELDRAIGEWKQQLLEEAHAMSIEDIVELREQMRQFQDTVKDARGIGKDTLKAADETRRALTHFDVRFGLYVFGMAFLGGILGGFVMFFFLWHVW